jgi:hypothetical protein
LTYRGGGGGDEAEAVVEVELYFPFRDTTPNGRVGKRRCPLVRQRLYQADVVPRCPIMRASARMAHRDAA